MRETKRRRLQRPPTTTFAHIPGDVISLCLFPFLTLKEHIVCSGLNRVMHRASGVIPTRAIQRLTWRKTIKLRNNQNLLCLQQLVVRAQCLTGLHLINCSNLRSLQPVAMLSQISTLVIQGCIHVTGDDFKYFVNLEFLRHLALANVQVKYKAIKYLGQLTQLKYLRFVHNPYQRGSGPILYAGFQPLLNLHCLEHFAVSGLQVCDTAFQGVVKNMPLLRYLNFSAGSFSRLVLQHTQQQCHHLQQLHIANENFDNHSLACIQSATLQVLSIHGGNYTNNALEPFKKNLPALQDFSLCPSMSSCQFTNMGASFLPQSVRYVRFRHHTMTENIFQCLPRDLEGVTLTLRRFTPRVAELLNAEYTKLKSLVLNISGYCNYRKVEMVFRKHAALEYWLIR